MSKAIRFIKSLGPGLLFASMAIGTSHLVLSTKAGAQYGWLMIIPIVLANLLKYPFFEFGVRYTHVTRTSLIQGYLNLGKQYLWLYAFVTLISTFTILAALYVVTAGLFSNLFDVIQLDTRIAALGLFLLISTLLILGRYQFLENALKAIIFILFIALLLTTFLVLFKGPVPQRPGFTPPEFFNASGVLFLISLVGWMPTAVEASGWVSLWSVEKIKNSPVTPSLKIALKEFNLGYLLTALLAIFFLIIGLMTLYGTATELSGNAVTFADQIVRLFTAHIGQWAYPIIAIAAFATMFSTCMTAHDAISRVSLDVLNKLLPRYKVFKKKSSYVVAIIAFALINWVVIAAFSANMGDLVALATFVSFVFAPILGWMNHKTVVGQDVPQSDQPKKALRILSYLGMFFLTAFALYYCWMLVR